MWISVESVDITCKLPIFPISAFVDMILAS